VRVLEALDAAAVRQWSRAATVSLHAHRLEIDRLNVFPVHDSDTGTNLATTMQAATDALAADPTDDAAEALQVLARAAVRAASGNSGNIVAQLLRALADVATEAGCCDAVVLREGLRRGAVEARAAVADPVEGTILTVAAAAAAALPDHEVSLAEVVRRALAAADRALGRTTEQLPVLARAGVVDAGAQGFVLLLEALVHTVGGAAPHITPVPTGEPVRDTGHQHRLDHKTLEVQYLLDTSVTFDDAAAEALRGALVRLGDSVVVVGTGDGTWSIHVHTDDAGAALEAGLAVGRPYRISVTHMDDESNASPKPGAVIAVAPGDGLARMFENEGVLVVAG
jgi:dihydroxyacetone kinase-like predicted kinase